MAARSPSKTRAVPSKTSESKPGALHDGSPRGPASRQDRDAAGPWIGFVDRAQHLAVEVRRVDVGEVLGHRLAGDGEAVAVQQTGVEQGLHDDGMPPMRSTSVMT
jgi:hypothetical protein